MIVAVIIAVAAIVAVARVVSPWRPRAEGVVLRSLRMPLRARVVNQAAPLAAFVVALGLNELRHDLAFWVPLVPLATLAIGVAIPARYTITTDGIMVGALRYRRWTEFSGLTVRSGRIRCKSISGVRPLQIWLPGRFHDADTVAEIRRLIRGAYKGSGAPAAESEDAVIAEASPVAIA